jgi:arsenite-transporting ATPase
MIPGFNYLIYLGKIIFELKNDPDLHIVFDSPSSGHALTMIKAPQNFADIFKSGILYEDTQSIRDFLFKNTQTQVNIISIPTQMSCNEAVELQNKLHEAESGIKSKIFLNNILSLKEVSPDELPDFLKEKFNNEQEIIKSFQDSWTFSVPRANATQAADIVKEIVPFMKNLV